MAYLYSDFTLDCMKAEVADIEAAVKSMFSIVEFLFRRRSFTFPLILQMFHNSPARTQFKSSDKWPTNIKMKHKRRKYKKRDTHINLFNYHFG